MIVDDRQKVRGHFYWIATNKGRMTSQKLPIDSGTPEPKPYLMKVPLGVGEIDLSLLILEKRYPYQEE